MRYTTSQLVNSIVITQKTVFKHKSPKPNHREITVPVDQNPLLAQVLDVINSNEEVRTLWRVVNTHAMKRLGMTDHGQVHFQIVSKTSLKLLRLLTEKGIQPSIVTDFNLTPQHAEVVVLLASLFHDIGMSIHRKGHEEFSVMMSFTMLKEVLQFLPVEERTILVAEVLHAIISHRKDGQPLTLEAGIVRVADALDMTKGRSRIPYQAGMIDIHSVSAMAIDDIEIRAGRHLPVEVDIIMNHTAGIFQVDELLKQKVKGSGIEQYLDIKVYMDKGEGRQLFKDFYTKK